MVPLVQTAILQRDTVIPHYTHRHFHCTKSGVGIQVFAATMSQYCRTGDALPPWLIWAYFLLRF